MNEEGAGKDLSSEGPVVSTSDLVRDLLNSILEVVGKCGERRMKDEAKPAFSEEQRLVLEQAFSENSYSSGNTLNSLATRLGVDSRRIMGWFGHRRRKENKAIAKKAEAALTWPNYKLSSKKPSLQDSTPGEVSYVALDDAEGQKWLETDGNALLEGFADNVRKAESKALDSVCAASIPLLWVPLTQQQMVHCARTLDKKSWDLGSKAAFLLVLTDQVCWKEVSFS